MPSAIAKPAHNEVAQTTPQAVTETKEAGASANASAGVNLNIFGTIAGAFSGKSKKDTAADGTSIETTEEIAKVEGVGQGNFNAAAAANAENGARHSKTIVH